MTDAYRRTDYRKIVSDEVSGLVRRDFYRRIAHDLHELQAKKKDERFEVLLKAVEAVDTTSTDLWREEPTERMMYVDIQETLDRLTVCPVCGNGLQVSDGYPLERSCDCGEFVITKVGSDGDVILEFHMLAPWKLEPDAEYDQDEHRHEPESGSNP